MRVDKTAAAIPGCLILRSAPFRDDRGAFVKTYNKGAFRGIGIEDDFVEEYYSVSRRGVVRGMHFQLPPSDHAKIVYCVRGSAFDVFLDARPSSPSFGSHGSCRISGGDGTMVYLPKGIAHGFQALEEDTILCYRVSSGYDPERDSGVRWDPFGCEWPEPPVSISGRDSALIPFRDAVPAFFLGGRA